MKDALRLDSGLIFQMPLIALYFGQNSDQKLFDLGSKIPITKLFFFFALQNLPHISAAK